MKLLYRLLLLVPLVALVPILQAAYERLVPLNVGNAYHNTQMPALDGKHRIGQVFNLPYPGLYRIDVHMTNYGKAIDRPIVFSLKTDPDADDPLATATVEARDIPDQSWVSFTFPPVDLERRTLYVELQSPMIENMGGIGLTADTRNPYQEGHIVLDGAALEADLHFFTYFRPPPQAMAGIILERMAAKKTGLWGEPRFYVALFAAYLVVTLAFLWRVLDFAFQPETAPAKPAPPPPAGVTEPAEPERVSLSSL